jgi:hypothetical protein
MRILSGLIRLFGGLAGMAILLAIYNWIFIEGKGIPVYSGYYGPIIFPLSLYIAIVLIGYAIGGQKVLRKFPGFSDKRKEASRSNEK